MKKAGDLLGAFFDAELMRSAKGYSAFFSSWKRIVGDHLAAHSRIIELDKTVLVVEADHPGWIQLIQMKRSNILESIRKDFPDLSVTALSIRLRRDGEPLEPSEIREKQAPELDAISSDILPEESADKVRDPLAHIDDERFKETLRRLEKSVRKSSR